MAVKDIERRKLMIKLRNHVLLTIALFLFVALNIQALIASTAAADDLSEPKLDLDSAAITVAQSSAAQSSAQSSEQLSKVVTASHTDSGDYSIFNPVPREKMRQFSSDRPDLTESPITVDVGHFQIETSFFDYNTNVDSGVRDRDWALLETNLKLGIAHNFDLQFVFTPLTRVTTDEGGVSDTTDGFEDAQIRLKMNVWGNDGGDTALGIMPYITIPSGNDLSHDHVEGGVIVPFGTDIMEGLGFGAQLELDIVYNEEEDDYETELMHTMVFGPSITENLGIYLEYVGTITEDKYQAIFSNGITYRVNEDLQLDVGSRIGLNAATDDFGIFAGFTRRF